MRVTPWENFKCNTCEFLLGRNATHARFSPGKMRHVRVSPREKCNACELPPQEKCNRCAFLPSKESTHIIGFSPGETPKSRNYHGQRSNSKQHAISPREKCDTCEFLPGRNATGAHFSPGEIHTMSYRIFPREKSKNLGIVMASGARNATHASFSPGVMRHMRVSPREKSKQL